MKYQLNLNLGLYTNMMIDLDGEVDKNEINNKIMLALEVIETKELIAAGVVTIKGLGGDNLSNALMKAETKAKRRVTLSLAGLGMLDESEADSIPSAKIVDESILANEETERLNLIHDIESEMPKREFNLEEFYKFVGSEDLQNVSLSKLRQSAKALSAKPIKTGQLGQEWSK